MFRQNQVPHSDTETYMVTMFESVNECVCVAAQTFPVVRNHQKHLFSSLAFFLYTKIIKISQNNSNQNGSLFTLILLCHKVWTVKFCCGFELVKQTSGKRLFFFLFLPPAAHTHTSNAAIWHELRLTRKKDTTMREKDNITDSMAFLKRTTLWRKNNRWSMITWNDCITGYTLTALSLSRKCTCLKNSAHCVYQETKWRKMKGWTTHISHINKWSQDWD